jgi:hypothetical protein
MAAGSCFQSPDFFMLGAILPPPDGSFQRVWQRGKDTPPVTQIQLSQWLKFGEYFANALQSGKVLEQPCHSDHPWACLVPVCVCVKLASAMQPIRAAPRRFPLLVGRGRGQGGPDPLRQMACPTLRICSFSREIRPSPPIPIGWRRGSRDAKCLTSACFWPSANSPPWRKGSALIGHFTHTARGLHLLARYPAPTPDGQEAIPVHPNIQADKGLLPRSLLATGTSIWPRRRCDGERN